MEQRLSLRPYQQRVIDAARKSLPKNKHLIIYAPQGSGKSLIAGFMALGSVKKENKILILTHREEILKQNFSKMNMLGIDVQIINAKTKKLRTAQVYCAMSQTVISRCRTKPGWMEWIASMNFIIVDEVHRQDADDLYEYFNPQAWVVGLSASILRSGTMNQLGFYYSDIVNVVNTQELIDLRYLVPSKNYAFDAPKLDDVTINRGTGDYVQSKLQSIFKKPERYAGIISNYKRICPNKKTIAFTTGADHCIELCIEFNKAGIASKYLISEARPETDAMYSGERETLLRDFSDGKFLVLFNISILDTGFDCPGVEAIILDFSTKSYTKYSQCVGRGSRPFPGKEHFYVLDFGANIANYGIYETKPLMSLWHNPGGTGVPLTKECPIDKPDQSGKLGCGRLIPISAQDCSYCGYHFATEREIYEVELMEVIAQQKEDRMTIAQWCAQKVLEGWSNNRILCAVMTKNDENMKKAFEEARQVLKTQDGQMVSPSYYHFVKKFLLKKK